MIVTDEEKRRFLNDDLYNELRWLFFGAVTWAASGNHLGEKDPLAMIASLTHARALYEFYYSGDGKEEDNARATHFCSTYSWQPRKSELYKEYMGRHSPANKRIFHPVYHRPNHSGGVAADESSHIKNQVLNFARDLRQITGQFVQMADCQFTLSIRGALQKALREAAKESSRLRIHNPFDREG